MRLCDFYVKVKPTGKKLSPKFVNCFSVTVILEYFSLLLYWKLPTAP